MKWRYGRVLVVLGIWELGGRLMEGGWYKGIQRRRFYVLGRLTILSI